VVFDYLCPPSVDPVKRSTCRQSLTDVVRDRTSVYSPFPGNSLDCSLRGCEAEVVCTTKNGAPTPGTCSVKAAINAAPRTMAEDYLLFMDGLEQLRGAPVPAVAGVIPTQVLSGQDSYRVNTDTLNCRRGAGTGQPVELVLGRGQMLWAQPDSAAAPRVATDASTGKPWLRVARGSGKACYVSASFTYLTPAARSLPAPRLDGAIEDAVLRAQDTYEVVASALNCRASGTTTAAVLAVHASAAVLTAAADSAGAPRVTTDAQGKPWLKIARTSGAPCYVSASYTLLAPLYR